MKDSRATARPSRYRLPTGIRPLRYHLHLAPDLDAGTFTGSVTIEVSLARAAPSFTLHAADLEIDEAIAERDGRRFAANVSVSAYHETVTLSFEAPLASGGWTVRLGFRARLATHLRGLYAAGSGKRRYAFTQLEAADARRMFPCFDEPSFKARFRISVTARTRYSILSNMPVESERPTGRGRKVVTFAETPLLSTYLLAVAVGELECSRAVHVGPTPIRVWAVPGKRKHMGLALEAAAAALERLERYFGIPYPYPKLDLLAVPDFEAGAMENAGAVFFRETLLLLDPATISLGERKRAAEVIAHELAHMWYGDLVTMAWWDDLWLNEAFATWMAYRVVDEWKPEWRLWQSYEHGRAAALGLDALVHTHPIYAPVRSVAEATENFDAITYEKGAAVVRMIEHYLGAGPFRRGVRLYMRRHREGNAVAADLWRALEEASGREVARVAQAWIEKAGFPLLHVGSGKQPGEIRLRQERFFADPAISSGRRREIWPIPLVARSGRGVRSRTGRALLDKSSGTVKIPAGEWIYGNAGAGGFYRVRHEPAAVASLLPMLPKALTAVERMALAGDQWALVRAGKAGIGSFLDVVKALRDEVDYDVLLSLAGPLSLIDHQVVMRGADPQRRFRAWVAECFEPGFSALGWRPRRGEEDPTRLRRAALLQLAGGIGNAPSLVVDARERLDAYIGDRRSLDPNLADAVVSLAARSGDPALYRRYRKVVSEARTPQERRRFLLALAAFRSRGGIRETLRASLTSEIPTQDVGFVLIRLLANPDAGAETWAFLTRRWRAIRKRVPPLMISRLVEATPSLREPRYAREIRSFFRSHPIPEASRALKQAFEVFRLNAELRRRTAGELDRWLRE